jgi:3-methylcrotonyl-CoA carboxylase alpha subunit
VQYQRQGWLFNGQPVTVLSRAGHELALAIAGRRVAATVVEAAHDWHVFAAGAHALLSPHSPIPEDGADDDHGSGLVAPMSGVIVQLLVAPGASVQRGTALLVMEAMKMEHKVCAPADGVVKQFLCAAGNQVKDGQELVEFEPG